MRLARHGHKVVVANPYASSAASRFAGAGGVFMQPSIEWLAPSAHFDLICENYPFTLTQIESVCEQDPCPVWLSPTSMRAYVMARLKRLALCGRWIVFTESPGFANALRSMAHQDRSIRRTFGVRIFPLTSEEAPRSSYPHLTTRFQVIIQRRCGRLHQVETS